MEKMFVIALIISVAFVCFRVIETKFVKKEEVDLKTVVVDTLLVYLSSIIGIHCSEWVPKSIISGGSSTSTSTPVDVFTDAPKF